MKKRISNSIISVLLVFAVFVTSIPMMSWTAIAQTIVPAILGAQDDSVAETSADISAAETGTDIKVDYPTTADDSTIYVEGNGGVVNWAEAGFASPEALQEEWFKYSILGIFDGETYIMLNQNLIGVEGGYYASRNGNTVTYHSMRLYAHWTKDGVPEGRVASPFFCIDCYLKENWDLYKAYVTDRHLSHSDARVAAWNHFKNTALEETSGRVLSPIINTDDYRALNPDVVSAYGGQLTNRQMLEHYRTNGMNAWDLRKTSLRVDHIAYFYNNNSIYHTDRGVLKCYSKLIKDLTYERIEDRTDGCMYHKDVVYTGNIALETFTGTLTSVGAMKNIALDENDALISTTPSNAKNQLWQFVKKENNTYNIRLAETSGALTYDDTSTVVDKYLCASDDGYVHWTIESIPRAENPEEQIQPSTEWYIYKKDGLYVLRPNLSGGAHNEVLNIADNGNVNLKTYGNPEEKPLDKPGYDPTSTAYTDTTMNQRFIINTTYDTEADSDELSANFFASVGTFWYDNATSNIQTTNVALTLGDKYLRTRVIENGNSPAADQYWKFIRQSDGTYMIQNTATSTYLSAKPVEGNHRVVNNQNIEYNEYIYYASFVTEKNDSDNYQKWYVTKRDDGGYLIWSAERTEQDKFKEGAHLRVTEDLGYNPAFGSLLYVDAFKGKSYSVFDIQQTSTQPFAENLNGTDPYYAYISSGKTDKSGYYLKNDVQENYDEVAVLTDETGKDIKLHNFYWKFIWQADNSYLIESTTTVHGYLTYENGQLTISTIDPDKGFEQRWFVFEYAGGYRLQNKRTGKVIEMDANGNLRLADKNANNYNDYQLFNIKETDMSMNSAAETFKINLFNYGALINTPTDPKNVLEFTTGDNSQLDRRNPDISAGSILLPKMSRVLDENNCPYVEHYAYAYKESNKKLIEGGEDRYQTPLDHFRTPNYYRSGSLQYLFDPSSGYQNGNKSTAPYDPTAPYGDDYISQVFKVSNPSGLFQKDADGYYYFDSEKNSVTLDVDYSKTTSDGAYIGEFKLFDYLTHPYGYAPLANRDFRGMFLPFNLAHEDGVLTYDGDMVHNLGDVITYHSDATNAGKANYMLPALSRNNDNSNEQGDRTKAPDMWFGMTLETDFIQTKDGKLDGEDVKFEFDGDDDVWVYLDGILVLDLSCTPHVKNGSVINFADSTVSLPRRTEYSNDFVDENTKKRVVYPDGTVAQQWAVSITDDGFYCPTDIVSLYSQYYAAYKEAKDDKKAKVEATIRRSFGITEDELPAPVSTTDDPKYKDFEEHNLKFFYLERGAGASNCKIKLNTLSGGTTVTKKVDNLNDEVADTKNYKFQIVSVDENGTEEPIADAPYTVSSANARSVNSGIATASDLTTDENGYFTIKANQTAIFGKIPLGTKIIVKEIVDETDDALADTSWEAFAGTELLGSGENSKITDQIIVPEDNTLDVVFTNDYYPSQDVTIKKVYDNSGESDNHTVDTDQVYEIGYEILDKNMNVVVNDKLLIHANEEKVIKHIPVGYTYRVWEYVPNSAFSFEAPRFEVNNKDLGEKVFVARNGVPDTAAYHEHKVLEGDDDKIVITNKIAPLNSITITFQYYNRKRMDGAPAQINSNTTSYRKKLSVDEWSQYLNATTQRINFSKLITEQGITFNKKIAVDNIVDEYVVWTSQAEAQEGIAKEINYSAGKDADGEYQTYGDTVSAENLAYHTDAYGNVLAGGDKWVTFKKGSTEINPEVQGNDTEVTDITVWLFNKPKEYTAVLHTMDQSDMSTASREGDYLIGGKDVTFKAFYNQRIANNPDNDSKDSLNESFDKYLGAYHISDSDVVTGLDEQNNEVSFIDMPPSVTLDDDESNEPYNFLYWSYDAKGRFVASTSFNYAYRITNDIELYAVYGKSEFENPGLTVFKNGIDTYISGSNNKTVRLNTMMNPYNCQDNDETITDAAIMYVMLHGNDNNYKDMEEAQLLALLSQELDDGSGRTNLDVLRDGIKAVVSTEVRAASITKTGQVFVVDVYVTASGFKYSVQNSSGTESSKLNLSIKNRIQFTTEFNATKLTGKHMLGFAAMKKDGEWYVSDNYADYNFVNYNVEK